MDFFNTNPENLMDGEWVDVHDFEEVMQVKPTAKTHKVANWAGYWFVWLEGEPLDEYKEKAQSLDDLTETVISIDLPEESDG